MLREKSPIQFGGLNALVLPWPEMGANFCVFMVIDDDDYMCLRPDPSESEVREAAESRGRTLSSAIRMNSASGLQRVSRMSR